MKNDADLQNVPNDVEAHFREKFWLLNILLLKLESYDVTKWVLEFNLA